MNEPNRFSKQDVFKSAKAISIVNSRLVRWLSILNSDRRWLLSVLSITAASVMVWSHFVLEKTTPLHLGAHRHPEVRRFLCDVPNPTLVPAVAATVTTPPFPAPTQTPDMAPTTAPVMAPTMKPVSTPVSNASLSTGLLNETVRNTTLWNVTVWNSTGNATVRNEMTDKEAEVWRNAMDGAGRKGENTEEVMPKSLLKISIFCLVFPIVFQMTLILLTTMKAITHTLMSSSQFSIFSKFVTLNDLHDLHLFLGYSITGLVILLTVLAVGFEGHRCWNEEDERGCEILKSYVMTTGYALTVLFIFNAVVAYYRFSNYSFFYKTHVILVAVSYFVSVIHTFGRLESFRQSFNWFCIPLLLKAVDAAFDYLFRFHKMDLSEAGVIGGRMDASKALLLKVKRPSNFGYFVGNFVYVRQTGVDKTWHPFSLASRVTDEKYLEFYTGVVGPWTDALHRMLTDYNHRGPAHRGTMQFDLMGPYGTVLAQPGEYDHVLAIALGTGVAPKLSLIKGHIWKLCQLDPEVHWEALEKRRDQVQVPPRTTLAMKTWLTLSSCWWPERVESRLGAEVAEYRRKIRFKTEEELLWDLVTSLFSCLVPVLGVILMVGYAFLRNNMEIYMANSYVLHLELQGALSLWWMFMFLFIFVWDWDSSDFFVTIFDASFSVAGVVWFFKARQEEFHLLREEAPLQELFLVGYFAGIAWFTLRTWYMAVKPRDRAWLRNAASRNDNAGYGLERLDVVWSERKVEVVETVLDELSHQWADLRTKYTAEQSHSLCRIAVHVTGNDPASEKARLKAKVDRLVTEDKLPSGCLYFGRPNLQKIIELHTVELASNSAQSVTLLTYCGAPKHKSDIQNFKTERDLLSLVTGHEKHQMDFIAESFGPSVIQRSRDQPIGAASAVASADNLTVCEGDVRLGTLARETSDIQQQQRPLLSDTNDQSSPENLVHMRERDALVNAHFPDALYGSTL